eukprot:CAMPEP_0173411514 /NCGR_PEP_ID=MMETSP1356-20130122/77203_1 /TAXON_ID=77927 ORGANISM="Hemiselmis virescens, Strain PCC157" /NCGR_SAMPLE_ID=MMETSP1356 /ASSEMBLY_ACC=CAM_ASM_000847 /LENGTH=59 /DNA_ID=CAMNT_0014373287 /DNA_START=102 /DNA_END=278 /DNA_ORIENTATION=-
MHSPRHPHQEYVVQQQAMMGGGEVQQTIQYRPIQKQTKTLAGYMLPSLPQECKPALRSQ